MGKISDKCWTLHSLWTSELLKNKIICSFSLNLFKTFNTISFKSSVMTLECFVSLVVWTFFQFIVVTSNCSFLKHRSSYFITRSFSIQSSLVASGGQTYEGQFETTTSSLRSLIQQSWIDSFCLHMSDIRLIWCFEHIFFWGEMKKLRYVYFIDKSFLV